jgi:hypothetical protein
VFDGATQVYSPFQNSTISWPGRSRVVPVDVAPSSASFSTTWLLVGSAAAATVVVAGLLICVRKKYKGLQHLMFMLFSEVVEITGSIFMCVPVRRHLRKECACIVFIHIVSTWRVGFH